MSKYQSDSLTVREVFRRSGFSIRTILALSTFFGAGLCPVAPGTLGTLASVPVVLCLYNFGVLYRALILVFITAIAIRTSGKTQDLMGQDDPSEVVIDEAAGFLLTMIFLPFSWLNLGLGFILFRFFDIVKPFPIKRAEGLSGGIGIVMDDLIAGIYALAGVRIFLFFAE